jgi:hypothetical protein
MKYVSFISLIILLASCKSPFFSSANDMRNINGTVYLKNGEELGGPISSALDNYNGTRGYIELSEKGNNKARRIPVAEIKGISVRNNLL